MRDVGHVTASREYQLASHGPPRQVLAAKSVGYATPRFRDYHKATEPYAAAPQAYEERMIRYESRHTLAISRLMVAATQICFHTPR